MAKTPSKKKAAAKPAAAKTTTKAETADSPLVEMQAKAREAADTDDPLRALKNERQRFNELFAKADAEAQAAIGEELNAGLQVRGW